MSLVVLDTNPCVSAYRDSDDPSDRLSFLLGQALAQVNIQI